MAYNDRDSIKSAQRQFLVKIRGVEGYFAQKSGAGVTAAVSKVWDGGRKRPSVLASPAEIENITVTRPYRTFRDDNVVRVMRNRVGYWRTTVTIQPTNANLDRVGKPTVYAEALLVGLREPDADAGSGEAATYELEFACGTVN